MIIPSTLPAKRWDRIRLIAIGNMKGAFGNEGALRFLKRDLVAHASRVLVAAFSLQQAFLQLKKKSSRTRDGFASTRDAALPNTTALLCCQISGYGRPEL